MRNTARLGPMPSTLDSIDDYDRGARYLEESQARNRSVFAQ